MNGQFELLTKKEFASALKRKPAAIDYLERLYGDEFPSAVKIGRAKLYRLVDVEEWLQARFEEAGIDLEENENEN